MKGNVWLISLPNEQCYIRVRDGPENQSSFIKRSVKLMHTTYVKLACGNILTIQISNSVCDIFTDGFFLVFIYDVPTKERMGLRETVNFHPVSYLFHNTNDRVLSSLKAARGGLKGPICSICHVIWSKYPRYVDHIYFKKIATTLII
jgi:hypothetical protein